MRVVNSQITDAGDWQISPDVFHSEMEEAGERQIFQNIVDSEMQGAGDRQTCQVDPSDMNDAVEFTLNSTSLGLPFSFSCPFLSELTRVQTTARASKNASRCCSQVCNIFSLSIPQVFIEEI